MTGRMLAAALLVIAVSSPTGGDEPAMARLLTPLDLAGYRPVTEPPTFSGSTLDGRQVSLTDLRGKVIVVNFWASWCRECRPEMPVLERLHREYTARGLAVIGINAREERDAVRRYAAELGLTFPLVLDPGGKITDLYGVIGIPTTFIVARDGRAVALAVGPRNWEGTPGRALIEALLAEPEPRAP